MKKCVVLIFLGLAIISNGCGNDGGDSSKKVNNKLRLSARNVILKSAYATESIDSNVDTDTQVLAENVVYDNAGSILKATNAQDAFDNLAENLEKAIVGTWVGYVIYVSTDNICEKKGMDRLGFHPIGDGNLLQRLDNHKIVFTAQSEAEDGTYTFSGKNFFSCLCEYDTHDTLELSGTYRVVGNMLFARRTLLDGTSYVSRYDNVQVIGDRLKILYPNDCVGYYERQ